MEKIHVKNFLCLILLLCLGYSGYSQNEIHYSQFYNATLNLNPALTGIFNGDKRFSGNYRSQWRTVRVPYTTFTANYDQKIYSTRNPKLFYGVGGNLNYDIAGDGRFGMINLNGLGSLTFIPTSAVVLTGGLGVGVGQRSIRSRNLNFSDQWIGDQFIENPTTGEKIDIDEMSFFYPEIQAGVNARIQQHSRTKIDFGLGVNHLNTPRMHFYKGDESKLPVSFAYYGLGSVKVGEPFDILLNVAYKQAGEYHEFLYSGGVKVYLSTARGKEFGLVGGFNMRNKDAWYPNFEIHYNQFKAGVSYDFNTSAFDIATDSRGGLELSFQYIITEVKPLQDYKSCPVY